MVSLRLSILCMGMVVEGEGKMIFISKAFCLQSACSTDPVMCSIISNCESCSVLMSKAKDLRFLSVALISDTSASDTIVV